MKATKHNNIIIKCTIIIQIKATKALNNKLNNNNKKIVQLCQGLIHQEIKVKIIYIKCYKKNNKKNNNNNIKKTSFNNELDLEALLQLKGV